MIRREYRAGRGGAAALQVATVAAGIAMAAAVVVPTAAEARGFVGFSVGVPLVGPAYPYPPPPPPVVYGPPPAVVYAPPPAAVVPAPPPLGASVQGGGGNCREYQSTVTIDGRPQPTYGRACLQPDGTWRIVQ